MSAHDAQYGYSVQEYTWLRLLPLEYGWRTLQVELTEARAQAAARKARSMGRPPGHVRIVPHRPPEPEKLPLIMAASIAYLIGT